MMNDEADLDTLERRSASVKAVRQIVHAIWAVARAQLPLAQAAAADVTTYLDEVDGVLGRFTEPGPESATIPVLRVVVGPERPYCGALPARLIEQVPEGGDVGLVGTRLAEVATRDERFARRVRFTLRGPSTHDEAAEVAERIARAILREAGSGGVEVHHPQGGGALLHGAVLLHERPRLRPVTPPTLSPVAEVVARAVREAVAGRIAVAVAEAFWSEVQARMVTADGARRACDDELEELASAWRVARQDRITTELLEVVAGRAQRTRRPA
jgi:F-type H+-transporting ATPase subunit gamma